MSLSLLFVFHVVTPSAGGSSLAKHTNEETTTITITIEHGYYPLDKIICKLSPEEELVTPFNRQQLCSVFEVVQLWFGVAWWYSRGLVLRRVECVRRSIIGEDQGHHPHPLAHFQLMIGILSPSDAERGFLRHKYKYKYMGPLQSAVHMQHMYKCSTCKTYAAHVLYMQDRVGWMKIMPGKMQSIMQIAQRSGSECLPMLLCYRHRHNYHLYHDRDHRLSSFDQNSLPSLSLWFSARPVCLSNCLAMYCAAMIRRW